MNLQELIDSYQMPQEAIELVRSHRPLGLAGPTGAGKGTLAQFLTNTGKYSPIISDTTRDPRPVGLGLEVNGVHYWFLSDDKAFEKLQNDAYIEAKLVHGHTVYGTSISAYRHVVDAGMTPILDIDVQGMEEFMRVDPGFESIMLLPPSFEVWNQRLDGRGDMNPTEKIKRFNTALFEIDKLFENERFFPVINTEVVETAQVIISKSYTDQAYRDKALGIARDIRSSTERYLSENPVVF